MKIDGVEINTSHVWLGFDNSNYWIKATTNPGIAGTYAVTIFVTNGVKTIAIESFSIELVNPCLWKSNGSPQTVLAQTTTTFPSSWEVTAVSGTAQSFNYNDGYFKMEELPPSGITCGFTYSQSNNFSVEYQSLFTISSTKY